MRAATLRERAVRWAAHRYAVAYLAALAFAESSFLPIPPDLLLGPMTLAQRHRAWYFAAVTVLFAGLGGLWGYAIGHFGMEIIHPMLDRAGYWAQYLRVRQWFDHWGVWVLLISGFVPLPYKLFTISAGAASMALLPFVAASLAGRAARFFLLTALLLWGGRIAARWRRGRSEGAGDLEGGV